MLIVEQEFAMHELFPGIVVDPAIRFGKPVIKGTRVPVEILVGKVAGGMSIDEVAHEYGVTPNDVRAALSYAAERLAEETIYATD
jgi:uncharacterized protein (DUF433 family)